MPPTYIHFAFSITDNYLRKRRDLILHYSIQLFFIAMLLMGRIYTRVEIKMDLGYWPVVEPLFYVFLAFWLGQLVYAFTIIFANIKRTQGIKKEQLKVFVIASLFGYVGGVFNWFLWCDIPIPPYPSILISAFMGILAYGMIRFKFLNAAALTLKGVFVIVYIMILSLPFLLGYVTRDWQRVSLFLLILGILGPYFYRLVLTKAEGQLYSRQRRYQYMLKRIAEEMISYHDIDRLVNMIVRACVKSVNLNNAHIFLRDEKDKDYELVATRRADLVKSGGVIAKHNPLNRFLTAGPGYINVEAINLEYENSVKAEEKHFIREFYDKYGTSLLFPIKANEDIMGFLALGQKSNGAAYTPDDIEVFSLLSYQSALAITNCRYLNETQELYIRAVTDKLTGCYNRGYFEEYLAQAALNSKQTGKRLFVLMIDLDEFKEINDGYGHDAGDKVLAEVGVIFRKTLRKTDVVVRYGGDEFVVLLENVIREQVEIVARKLQESLASSVISVSSSKGDAAVNVFASMGAAEFSRGEDITNCVKRADEALYESKKEGKHNIVFAD